MKKRLVLQANARWFEPKRPTSWNHPHWKIFLGDQNVGRMDRWRKMDDHLFITVMLIATLYYRKLISYE